MELDNPELSRDRCRRCGNDVRVDSSGHLRFWTWKSFFFSISYKKLAFNHQKLTTPSKKNALGYLPKRAFIKVNFPSVSRINRLFTIQTNNSEGRNGFSEKTANPPVVFDDAQLEGSHLSGFGGISSCQSPGSGFFHPTLGLFRSSSQLKNCRGLLYGELE